MINLDQATAIILKLDRVKEGRRKHIITFRKSGRVFATLNEVENRSCLRLSIVDQDVFSRMLPAYVFRVPNKNGNYGWTLFMISKVPKSLYADAVQCAYEFILDSTKS